MNAYLLVDDPGHGVTHLLAHFEGVGWRLLCDREARVCANCVTYTPRLPLCLACSIVDGATADPSETQEVAR